jgi:hypothetical protein
MSLRFVVIGRRERRLFEERKALVKVLEARGGKGLAFVMVDGASHAVNLHSTLSRLQAPWPHKTFALAPC